MIANGLLIMDDGLKKLNNSVMKLIFATLIMACCLQIGTAQAVYFTDSLQMRDGTWKTGRVRFMNRAGSVQLENANGFIQSYKSKDIRQMMIHLPDNKKEGKITSKERPVKERCEKTYAFRERGLYSITYVGTINGIGHSGEMQLGLGLQQVTGFQINRMFGAGIGVGLENFSVTNANGPLVLPVYAEARGYFFKQHKTPYYALNVGYGFAFKNEDQNIIEAKGGWLLHPAVGFRLGSSSDTNFLFDLGYKFQRAKLTRDISQWNRETQEQRLLYKRFSVRIGIVF